MADLSNRIPGRMVLVFLLQPLQRDSDSAVLSCELCEGHEPAIGHIIGFLPPEFSGDPTSATDMADHFEHLVAEQAQGRFRMTTSQAIGIACLASLIATHQQRDDEAVIAAALGEMPMPERLVGVWAVEPGTDGKLFPMVVAINAAPSLRELYLLINAPLGSLDAGLSEVLPEPPEH